MILKLARSIADSMRTEPFALALVVVNIMWLVWGGNTVREIANAVERRDQIMTLLIEQCGPAPAKGGREN